MEFNISQDYKITSDAYNYIINEKKIYESGKNKGKKYFKPIAYYNTLDGLLTGYFDIKLKASGASGVQEVLKEIKEIKAEIELTLSKLKEV